MLIIAKKERISHMNDIKDRKVAQHNDLITSVAKMDKTPLKIFELAVSCIDTDNPPKDNIVYLSKEELFTFFDVSDSNKHSRFKEAVEKMQKQAFFQIKEEKDKGFKFKSIVPIPFVEWNDFNDEVLIRFDVAIMPYLIDLKKNFTQYAITDIMDLESKYSIIIYKWLSMNYNQFEKYQFKNNRTQKQLKEYQNPRILIRELREMTDTINLYEKIGNFEKRVIKNAVDEISRHTHFNVSYDKIKKGRSISEIQFHIEKKAHWKDEEYKRNDEVAQRSIEQREQAKAIEISNALSNPYTIQLLSFGLISVQDITNKETLYGLSQLVYPIYDEIIKEYKEGTFIKHLDYLSEHIVDYTSSKKNIVKYLQISAQQYLKDAFVMVDFDAEPEPTKRQATKKQPTKKAKKVVPAPEWSNTKYVDTTTNDEKAKFAEWQKNINK